MKDFLQKYHNKKTISNIGIVLTSLVLAFWINFLLIDWTEIWNNLKTSVLDIETIETKSDLYIENWVNTLIIKNSKDMQQLKNISLWLTYNPSEVEIISIKSKLWEVISLWEKNTWFDTVLVKIEPKNIIKTDDLFEIETKKLVEKSTQINMINANFKDSSESKYNLSTSWITF